MSKLHGKRSLGLNDLGGKTDPSKMTNRCGTNGECGAGADAKDAVREVSTKEESGKVAMEKTFGVCVDYTDKQGETRESSVCFIDEENWKDNAQHFLNEILKSADLSKDCKLTLYNCCNRENHA